MVAYALFLYGAVIWWGARRNPNGHTRFAFNAMFAVMLLQVILGIMTALYSAPVHIAIVHQIGAVALWVLILRGRYLVRYPLAQSIRGDK
jgi:cytochrome c oxidase assembly protein subunit 15